MRDLILPFFCRFFLKFFLKCNQNCLKNAGNPRDMRRFQVSTFYSDPNLNSPFFKLFFFFRWSYHSPQVWREISWLCPTTCSSTTIRNTVEEQRDWTPLKVNKHEKQCFQLTQCGILSTFPFVRFCVKLIWKFWGFKKSHFDNFIGCEFWFLEKYHKVGRLEFIKINFWRWLDCRKCYFLTLNLLKIDFT